LVITKAIVVGILRIGWWDCAFSSGQLPYFSHSCSTGRVVSPFRCSHPQLSRATIWKSFKKWESTYSSRAAWRSCPWAAAVRAERDRGQDGRLDFIPLLGCLAIAFVAEMRCVNFFLSGAQGLGFLDRCSWKRKSRWIHKI